MVFDVFINSNMDKDCAGILHNYLLVESRNRPLISIDIQPFYAKYLNSILGRFVDFLNNHKGDVYYFYNGSEMGIEDDDSSISFWLLENGLNEDVLERIKFRPKEYSFFRNFMDAGMDRHELIKIIRYMVMNRIYDSRNIEEDQWKEILGNLYDRWSRVVLSDDNISIPDISIAELKQLSGCYLCGGGKHECLSEFKFLLEAFNIKYRLIESLIY